MFETALLPVNFRERPERVTALVRFLQNFGTRRILLVHVVSSGLESSGRAHRRLQPLCEQIASDAYETDCVVRSGSPALQINSVAEERGAQFICIPWKRKDFLQRTLLGSVTEDVVRLSERPVFVYKPRSGGDAPAKLSDVLYATSFDPSHERIIDYLRHDKLAAQRLHVLNVGERAPDPEAERRRRKRVFEQLSRFQADCGGCFEAVKPITTVGNPKREILRVARQVGAELIVLGKHGEERPLEKLLGSTAQTVTHKSRCSVLIVPVA